MPLIIQKAYGLILHLFTGVDRVCRADQGWSRSPASDPAPTNHHSGHECWRNAHQIALDIRPARLCRISAGCIFGVICVTPLQPAQPRPAGASLDLPAQSRPAGATKPACAPNPACRRNIQFSAELAGKQVDPTPSSIQLLPQGAQSLLLLRGLAPVQRSR